MSFCIKRDRNDNQSVNLIYTNINEAISHCPEGYSVFDLYGNCMYTKKEQGYVSDDTSVETTLIKFEHDKYRYIWEQLKGYITNKINGLHEPIESDSVSKRLELLVEERELMRILMMMKSLENEPNFKPDSVI